MVKKIVTLFATILIVISIFAQVPQKMSYQAIVRNSYNVLVTNKKVSMKISILQNQSPVYVELQNTTTNENGLINVEIGNGIVLSGVFANIEWGKGIFYIKTETDPDGGTYYSIVGSSELLSVPYALYSTASGSGVSIDDTSASTTKTWSSNKINSELGNKVNSSTLATVATTGNFSDLKGKPTTLAGYGITDVGTGTGTSLPMSGDATQDSTGVVTISNNAITTSKILDGTVGNADLNKPNIPLSGFGAPTANIPMGGFKITNLATPVNAKDAVNKSYVDQALLTTTSPVLSLDAAQNLSIKGGNAVSLADLYQSLSLAGTILSISGPRDSHVDLAAIFGSAGGSGGSGIVSHDTSLSGSGTSLSLLGIASQAITPTKISGIFSNGNYGQVLTSNGSGSFNWTDMGSGSGGGLTAINVIPSNGITASVSNILPTSTISLGLGAITPSSINTSGSITTTGTVTGSTLNGLLDASNLTGTISPLRYGANTIPVAAISGSGTAGTFLKGDGTWGVPVTGSTVASGISNTAIAGVPGTNVQSTLEGLKSLVDTKATATTPTGGAATHTKITYNANGLVTAGVDATTADITESTDKKYVTNAQSAVLANTSGINTGDQTAILTPVTTITGVTGTNVQSTLEGLKSLIDGNTSGLTSKVTGNTSITGATHTKITYDSKGLVTAGVDATTADITESTDKKYVTNAQSAVLANTSGINTGDQTAILTPVTTITGVTGTNVQSTLEGLKSLIDGNTSGLTSKVTGNTSITGATHTKITYDSKGLVTAGVDATTADIAESTDKKYVTNAQSTLLTNTSGINTGDQTATLTPVTAITGVTGTNVQSTLEGLKSLIDSKATATTPTGGAAGHTKITYNANGLVTAGADAPAAEVTVAAGDGISASNVQAALKELSGRITTASAGGMSFVLRDATLTGDGNTTSLGLADNAVSTSKIADNSVTLAKMANLTGPALLGKVSTTPGIPEVITIGSGLTLTGSTLSANGSMAVVKTDATLTGDGNTTNLGLADNAVSTSKIADNSVTLSKMANLNAKSLIGNSTASSAKPEQITIGSGLTLNGGILAASAAGNQTITFAPTGDVTGTTTGTTSLAPALTIGTGKVTNSMLATGIDAAKLTTGVLPSSAIPTTLPAVTSIGGMTVSTSPALTLSAGTNSLTATGTTTVSGTNTGDQDAAKVNLNPALISGITGSTVQAVLTDIGSKLTQNTSDIAKKIDANSDITPGTNQIVSYDKKGLVTAGIAATTAYVADIVNKRYVTDAQLTLLGKTTGTNSGDQTLSVAAGKLKISGATGNSVDVVTSLTAGSGLTGTGTLGDVTLSLGSNAIKVDNLQGSSGALTTANATSVLRSNADGTFSWLDIAAGSLPVDPSSITLAEKMFFIGNNLNKASEIAKSSIPLSGFAVPTVAISMGGKQINDLAAPTADNDAVTKKYVDDASTGAVVYQDTYDATTGYIGSGTTPLGLANANKGNYYVVKTAGSAPGFPLSIGDWVISNGVEWSKVANSQVAYTTATVPESGVYKYYTDARALDKENVINKTGSITTETDDTKYPSVKAIKSYVDAKVPASLGTDNGKVLTVNSSGIPIWQTGGGTVKTISIFNNSNGITGVSDGNTTNPSITLTLGNIKPSAITTTGAIDGGAITGTSVLATGTITGSNITSGATLSGINTGDQTITLTGPVTGSGKGSFATTISDNAITSAKIADKAITYSDVADATITPAQMNITGTATVGAVPAYNASGGFTWGTGGGTSLTYLATSTGATLASSTGNTVPIGLVDATNAGLIKPADFTKLSGLSNYTLPIASSGTLGGVKVGTGLSIDGSGILSSTAGFSAIPDKTLLGNNAGSSAIPTSLDAATVKTILALSNVENTKLTTWTGTSTLTTVGTIGAGTWNGGTIDISHGGTNAITASGAVNNLLPAQGSNNGKVLQTDGTNVSWVAVGGSGTVTSVGLSLPLLLSASSFVTTTGNITATLALQSANTVLAGPPSGTSLAPTFRQIVAADITGSLTQNTSGNAATATNIASGVAGNLLYQSAPGTTAKLANGTVAGQVLTWDATNTKPSWSTPINSVAVADGLTVNGATTAVTSGAISMGIKDGSIAVKKIQTSSAWATDNTKFLSASGDWLVPASGSFTGVLPVLNGGTGISGYNVGEYIHAIGATTLARITKADVIIDLGAEVTANKSGTVSTQTDDVKYPSVKAVKSYVDTKVPDLVATTDANKVLTANPAGTAASWQTPTGGSGGSVSIYNALNQAGTAAVPEVLVKGSGSKIRFWVESAAINILHVSIPNGSMVDYVRIFATKPNMTIQGDGSYSYYLKITDESSNTNTSYSNALVPNLRFMTVNVLSPSTSTGTWIPASDIAPNQISIEDCSGGSLLIANACSTSDIADTPGGIYIILSY